MILENMNSLKKTNHPLKKLCHQGRTHVEHIVGLDPH